MNDTTAILPLLKLRFNVEHPSIEECYCFGYECAQAEVEEADNPFENGTREYDYWNDGWWAAFYGEAPLFDLTQEGIETPAPLTEINAANDKTYHDTVGKWLLKAIEITGVIAVSAVVGYQVLDMVA